MMLDGSVYEDGVIWQHGHKHQKNTRQAIGKWRRKRKSSRHPDRR